MAAEDYKEYIFNEEIGEKPIFVKSDGYPMQIVQVKSTIDELNMKRGEYIYACAANSLGRDPREAKEWLKTHGKTVSAKQNNNQNTEGPDNNRGWARNN